MNKGITVILSVIAALLLLSEGCASIPEPSNLEPEIKVFPPSGITRNDATLKAVVTMRGTGRLSFFRFRYGETEAMVQESPALPPGDDTIRFRLSGLKAGTEYLFSAEGGDDAAVIRSQVMTFTTMPNVAPTLSDAVSLSSGPVGLIVGFGITSDGGTRITGAGCDLLNLSTGEKIRHQLEGEELTVRDYRMYINIGPETGGKGEYVITPYAVNEMGESFGKSLSFIPEATIYLAVPGNLSTLLADYDPPGDSIVVAGKMNGDDFRFLRRLLGAPPLPGEEAMDRVVSVADLSNADIVAGGAPYDGSRFTTSDTVSTGLFADCRNLKGITLPISATAIAGEAFSGSGLLRELTIPVNVRSVEVSAGCPSLEKISVAPANNNFNSFDGILCNKGLTEIIWSPPAKTGHLTVPPSVARIRDFAFSSSRISSISLHPGITAIGRGAFSGSMLEEITLPDVLSNLSEGLFHDSSRLSVVKIGEGTDFIGNYVFAGTPLGDIYLKCAYPPVVSKEAFGQDAAEIFRGCILHVPSGSVSLYRNHPEWGNFNNIIPDTSITE